MFWKESHMENDFKSPEFRQKEVIESVDQGNLFSPFLYPDGDRGIPLSHQKGIEK